MELALPSLLRALVAEHRARGEDLQRQLLHKLAVRHEGAADAGRVFRPKGQRFVTAILEGVHLLRHDVGRLADAAGEQLGELEDRRRHLAVAVQARHVARGVDDVREAPVVVGEDIVRATHGLHLAHGKSPRKIVGKGGPGTATRRRRDVARLLPPGRPRSRPPSSRSARPDGRRRCRPSADGAERRQYRLGACSNRRR